MLSSEANAADSTKKKNPTSKFYVADVEGNAEINTGEKIEDLKKKSVYNAEGTVVKTDEKSTNAMAYSNGTGIYFDKDTQLEVRKFQQEPFTPNRVNMEVEPSISHTQAFLSHGAVGLCTSKLVAGSVMNYATSHAMVAIRGRKVLIQTSDKETKVSLIEGDVTIRGGRSDIGGQPLRPGEQAVITPSQTGGAAQIRIQLIPPNERGAVEQKVSAACMAKSTVYFEEVKKRGGDTGTGGASSLPGASGGDAGDSEIVAVPVAPETPPVQFTVSNARIEGGPGSR